MDETAFEELLTLVTPLIQKSETIMRAPISPMERLSITLRFLATGNTFEDLKFVSAISPQSIGRIVIETCEAIISCLTSHIQSGSGTGKDRIWNWEKVKVSIMTSLYQTVKACIVKTPPSEQVEFVTTDTEVENPENVKEHDAQDFTSNKKTDEQAEQQAGIVWRLSSGLGSGLYNATTGMVGYGVDGVKGAVGYSVDGVKWAAEKSYDVGTAVASRVKVPAMPALPLLTKKKDKKE